jgi:hypothetical protein
MITYKNRGAVVQNLKDGPRALKRENLGSKTPRKGPIRKGLYIAGGYSYETIKQRGLL